MEIVIIIKQDNIFEDDRLKKLIKKIEEQVAETKPCPQVKIVIK